MAPDTVLVTGAAGFIGNHCCAALLGAGHRVVGLDNFDPFYPREIKEAGLEPLSARDGFEFHEGDIRDQELTRQLVADASVVLHLAARAGVRPSIQDPGGYVSVNSWELILEPHLLPGWSHLCRYLKSHLMHCRQ